MAPVGGYVLAQARHLERRALDEHGDRAVLDASRDRAQSRRLAQLLRDGRQGGRREIDFMHRLTEQGVADRTTDNARFLAVAV